MTYPRNYRNIHTSLTIINFFHHLNDLEMMTVTRMFPATPYRTNALGTFGNAVMMLLRQYNFPDEYDEDRDKFVRRDHDRCFQFDSRHTYDCLKRHGVAFDWTFETWARKSDPQKIISFLVDILKADSNIHWNGFRIIANSAGNGQDIWGLELFYKEVTSKTIVYSGENAPNVTV